MIGYAIFLRGLAQQWGRNRNEIWRKGSQGDEDDARTSNTCIAQRKRAIPVPHSAMKTNGNIIEWCNNTHQGAPRTGKKRAFTLQTSVTTSHITCVYLGAKLFEL